MKLLIKKTSLDWHRGTWVVPGPCRRSGPPSRKPGSSAPSPSATSPSTTSGPSSRCRGRTGGGPPSTASSTPSGELEQELRGCGALAGCHCDAQTNVINYCITCTSCCRHCSNMSDVGLLLKLWVSRHSDMVALIMHFVWLGIYCVIGPLM